MVLDASFAFSHRPGIAHNSVIHLMRVVIIEYHCESAPVSIQLKSSNRHPILHANSTRHLVVSF